MPVAVSSSTVIPPQPKRAWEQIVRRLEDAGFAVDPAAPGCAYFETRGVERLYGGLEPALKRALAAVGPGWDARIGAAGRRFAALAAANVARSGQALVVSDERTREFLAPLPSTLLPVGRTRGSEELEELGVKKLGSLPGCRAAPWPNVWGRTAGAPGAWREAVRTRAFAGARPPAELVETLEFPEAVGNELTLRRSLAVLLDRLLARPERGGRAPAQARALRHAWSAAARGGGR